MKIIKISGTPGKRALSEFVSDGIEGAWLLALECVEEGEGDTESPEDEVVSGRELEAGLAALGLFAAEDVVVLETNDSLPGFEPCLSIFYMDAPLDRLESQDSEAAGSAELALVEWGELFKSESELGLEKAMKSATGVRKVLIYNEAEGREKAFAKVLDMSLSRLGGVRMPEEVPEKVIEAVEREAKDNKISCGRAHELASELGVPVSVIGRSLDLAGIKIVKCRLGCF